MTNIPIDNIITLRKKAPHIPLLKQEYWSNFTGARYRSSVKMKVQGRHFPQK